MEHAASNQSNGGHPKHDTTWELEEPSGQRSPQKYAPELGGVQKHTIMLIMMSCKSKVRRSMSSLRNGNQAGSHYLASSVNIGVDYDVR